MTGEVTGEASTDEDRGWHLRPELLERFVLGVLDEAGRARLAAHVRCCEACAAALAAEARRELALQAIVPRVARRGAPAVRPAGRPRGVGSAMVVFGAAAIALLVVLTGDQAGGGLLGAGAAIGEREMLASVAPSSLMVCSTETESALCPFRHDGHDFQDGDGVDGGDWARASLVLPPAAAGSGGYCVAHAAACRPQGGY
jgi:hypothetical protein